MAGFTKHADIRNAGPALGAPSALIVQEAVSAGLAQSDLKPSPIFPPRHLPPQGHHRGKHEEEEHRQQLDLLEPGPPQPLAYPTRHNAKNADGGGTGDDDRKADRDCSTIARHNTIIAAQAAPSQRLVFAKSAASSRTRIQYVPGILRRRRPFLISSLQAQLFGPLALIGQHLLILAQAA